MKELFERFKSAFSEIEQEDTDLFNRLFIAVAMAEKFKPEQIADTLGIKLKRFEKYLDEITPAELFMALRFLAKIKVNILQKYIITNRIDLQAKRRFLNAFCFCFFIVKQLFFKKIFICFQFLPN